MKIKTSYGSLEQVDVLEFGPGLITNKQMISIQHEYNTTSGTKLIIDMPNSLNNFTSYEINELKTMMAVVKRYEFLFNDMLRAQPLLKDLAEIHEVMKANPDEWRDFVVKMKLMKEAKDAV